MRRRIGFAAAVSALAVAPAGASAGDGGFGGGTAFEEPRPSALAVGDFDNDGAPDLAAVSAGSKRVELFLPSPDGTVRSAPVEAGNSPESIAVADFNRDGKRVLPRPDVDGGRVVKGTNPVA
jgi:hypothetical protein